MFNHRYVKFKMSMCSTLAETGVSYGVGLDNTRVRDVAHFQTTGVTLVHSWPLEFPDTVDFL